MVNAKVIHLYIPIIISFDIICNQQIYFNINLRETLRYSNQLQSK